MLVSQKLCHSEPAERSEAGEEPVVNLESALRRQEQQVPHPCASAGVRNDILKMIESESVHNTAQEAYLLPTMPLTDSISFAES
jgi:hypothetical protein